VANPLILLVFVRFGGHSPVQFVPSVGWLVWRQDGNRIETPALPVCALAMVVQSI
jgi:hypothetical protein